VSFQAAIKPLWRRQSNDSCWQPDARRGETRYSLRRVPASVISHATRGRTYFGESSRRIPIFRFDIPIKRARFVYELVRDAWACVRACARARNRTSTSSLRWLHQNAWMVLEIEMGTKRQGVHDRTHADRCQTAGNVLTNVVSPSQPYRDKMPNTLQKGLGFPR